MLDDEFATAYAHLSIPAAADPVGLSRRRFLQAALGGLGVGALLPSWLADASFAAPPIGPNDGVLVALMMSGGNDGLNTVVPFTEAGYYSKRGAIAIPPGQVHDIGSGLGLHPNLMQLKTRWDQGKVAIVQGVGSTTAPDLSHFTSMANWMAGVTGTANGTGWLGRYLDGLGDSDPLRSVCIGTSTPLHCLGAEAKATALPGDINGAFGLDQSDPTDARMFDAVRAYGAAPCDRGAWGDAWATAGAQTMDLGVTVAPSYDPPPPNAWLSHQMVLAARLVNADLGLRVIAVGYGDFDSHASQMQMHADRMAELDAAIAAFYATLDQVFKTRVAILTFSEFGRRVLVNDSNGSDHGEASCLFVVGDNVAGGLYGEYPSLGNLHDGNLIATVDYRSVYASLLGPWLAADSTEILGGTWEDLGLFAAGPGA